MDEIIREVRRSKRPFEDCEFPCTDKSLFFSRRPPRPFEWKRPGELCDNPQMVVGGANRLDIQQGMLGDCWLLAAIAGLTQDEALLNKVVPKEYVADMNDPNYIGGLKFTIWQYGKWQEVIIDDRLPTYNGKLVFVHSNEKNEFWSALLEKAYAKMNGNYESLKGGQTGEALEDFTAGLSESFDLGKAPDNLFSIMEKAMARGALMGCSIAAKANEIEAKLNNGLVKGHAYTVTGIRKVKARTRSGQLDVELVRIRNPWGNEREWKGAWGDQSSEWSLLSDSEKRQMGLSFDDDGEFWMSYQDFIRNYTTLEVCMLGADSAVEQSKISFASRSESGAWNARISAGGCRNYIDSFYKNPQYRIKLEDSDDDQDDLCTIIVALMQKDRRKDKNKGLKMLTMGFSLYKVDDPKLTGKLDKEFFMYHASAARSPSFINSREVVGRFQLPAGEYVIIPSTFKPNEEGKFLLRIYSEKPHQASEVDQETKCNSRRDRKPQITREQHSSLDAKFREFFDSLSGDDDEIDAFELQQLLTSAFKKDLDDGDFSLESSRSIISMYDEDLSGKLGFDEFKETMMQVKKWKAIFNSKDEDHSGSMDAYELTSATTDAGFSLSNKIITAVANRFSNKKGQISFDDFVQVMVRLNVLSNAFEKHESRGKSTFSLSEFFVSGMVI